MEGYTDHALRADVNKSAEKSAEKPSSDMSESLNADTVIAAKEPSLKEDIPLVNNRSGDLAMSIDELSKKSNDPGERSDDRREFQSHSDLYKSPGSQPDDYRKREHYDYPKIPDVPSESERTESWNRLFGNRLMDPSPFDKMDPYEKRLRIRESETLQAMIDTQKQLIRKTRDRENEEIFEEEKRNLVYSQSDLQPELDSRSERVFQTPSRHTPDLDQSASRDRSHDADRVKERLFDGSHDNRNSSNSGHIHINRGMTNQEFRNEGFPPRVDNLSSGIGTGPSALGTDPSPVADEFYSDRRSPFEQRHSPYGAVSENPMMAGPTHYGHGEFLPLEPEQVQNHQILLYLPFQAVSIWLYLTIYGLRGIGCIL